VICHESIVFRDGANETGRDYDGGGIGDGGANRYAEQLSLQGDGEDPAAHSQQSGDYSSGNRHGDGPQPSEIGGDRVMGLGGGFRSIWRRRARPTAKQSVQITQSHGQ
jgi:hypothetical protein